MKITEAFSNEVAGNLSLKLVLQFFGSAEACA